MKNTFESALEKLNERQREAVETIDGPVMVIAGPGTGKTQVLTTRIAYILENTDTPPESILALTFTDAGVRAMRSRLEELIGRAAFDVAIHTFHSFAQAIIRDYPDSFPEIISSEQTDELESARIITHIVESSSFTFIKPKGDPYAYVPHISNAIQNLKREGISPDDFAELVEKNDKDFHAREDIYYTSGKKEGEMKSWARDIEKKLKKNHELLFVYKEYEQALRDRNLFDYEDTILFFVEALERDGDLLLSLQERFLYLHADEHQDANGAQNTILNLLVAFHDSPNIFVVGDDKQAIYRFQGASLQNFLSFQNTYPDARVIELVKNYRSTKDILHAAHTLIQNGPTLSETPLESTKEGKTNIYFLECETETAEAASLQQSIKKEIEGGTDPSSIAILARTHSSLSLIIDALNQNEVPVTTKREDLHIRTEQVLDILHAAAHPTDEPQLAKILFYDFFEVPPKEVVLLIERSKKQRVSLIDAADDSTPNAQRAIECILNIRKQSENMRLHELLDYAFEICDLWAAIVNLDDSRRVMSEVRGLFTILRNHANENLADVLESMSAARERHMLFTSGTSSKEGGVFVSTVHGAKGLEFESVYIAGATENAWNGRGRGSWFYLPVLAGLEIGEKEEAIHDERRLFYVAMTRAKTNLTISTPLERSDGRETEPTRFIVEIEDHLTKKECREASEDIIRPRTEHDSLFEPAFIRERFDASGLSPTGLNSYLSCPWEFIFEKLFRLPYIENPSAQYGSAVHSALEIIQKRIQAGGAVDKRAIEDIVSNAIEKFVTFETMRSPLTEKGERELLAFTGEHRDEWKHEALHEVPLAAELFSGGNKSIKLSGKIDRLEETESGLVVTDFKTGRPKSRNEIEGNTKNATGGYKRQLVFYALLIELSGRGSLKTAALDFVEPMPSGKLKREVFEITEEEKGELRKTIEDVAEEIRSGEVLKKTCDDSACRWCELRNKISV